MRTYADATVLGHVGRIDARQTGDATNVVNATVATNRRRGKTEITDWHRVVFWGRLADIARDHVRVGTLVLVHGELRTGSYDRDGQAVTYHEIHARELCLLPGGGPRPASPVAAPETVTPTTHPPR